MSTTAQKTDVEDEIPEVAARRLKKRELDRKAQRAEGERTKSHIANLEKLVEHLSHKDVNAEVSRLMEQLLQTTQERDKLIGFLASLGTTIRYHTDAFSAQSKGSLISVVGAMQALSELPEDIKSFDQTQAPEGGHISLVWRRQLFRANLTILWQSGFNDCFIKNPATSCFQLSPLFEDRIRDIKSWTMNVDFLVQFPELCDDIPMYGGIPTQPSTLRDVSWSMTSRPGVPKTKLREGVETAQPDEGAKSSALFVPSSVPGVVETEHVPQKGKEITTSGNSPFANEQPSSIVSLNMVPASLLSNGDMPSGQNVYSGGSWLYSYCQYGYNLGQEQ
ncbi:hypothetical protein EV126DRAFT_516627 [Verticillium dahliae]|nr:hypothetical protein EV126DRAFT_516627 [Verticillium dahliae]